MARVIVTVSIMPTSPDVNLEEVRTAAEKAITAFGAELGKHAIEPVAFGLKALKLFIITPEEKGSTEPLEKSLASLPGVESATVEDVRRALG